MDFLLNVSKFLPKNSICVEIGVAAGEFSANILTQLNPKQLILIDPWTVGYDKNSNIKHYSWGLSTAYSTNESFFNLCKIYSNEIENNQIIIKKAFSYEAVTTFPDYFFDFIYIDACHLYDCVKADLNNYLPKLKKDGLMCGHDYLETPSFGVIKAVDEFIINNNFKWLIKNEAGGDWALIRN